MLHRNILPVGNPSAHLISACLRSWYDVLCSRLRSALVSHLSAVIPQGLVKAIPGTSPGQTPIHEVENPLYGRMQK